MKKVLTIFLILFLGLPSFSYDEELLKFFPKEYLDEYFSQNRQGSNDIIDNWNGSNIVEGPGFNSYYSSEINSCRSCVNKRINTDNVSDKILK